jgi:hypothetical protein
MITFIVIYIIGYILSVIAICLELCREHPSEAMLTECLDGALPLILYLSLLSWIAVVIILIYYITNYIVSVSKNPFYKK